MNAHQDQLGDGHDDQLVAGYLRRLGLAAEALPADRRSELAEEISAHIAEARAAGPSGPGGPSGVRNILERLGDPAEIVRAATEALLADAVAGQAATGPAGGQEAAAGAPGGYQGLAGAPGAYQSAAGFADPGAAPSMAAAPAAPGAGVGPSAPGGRTAGGGAGALETAAVVLLLIGGIVVPVVGWVAGVVLMWVSPRWRTSDKLLGTLVWPGGLLLPLALVLAGGLAVPLVAYSVQCAPSGPSEGAMNVHGQPVIVHASKAAACPASQGPPAWLVIGISVIVLAAAIAGPVFTSVRLLRRARAAAAA